MIGFKVDKVIPKGIFLKTRDTQELKNDIVKSRKEEQASDDLNAAKSVSQHQFLSQLSKPSKESASKARYLNLYNERNNPLLNPAPTSPIILKKEVLHYPDINDDVSHEHDSVDRVSKHMTGSVRTFERAATPYDDSTKPVAHGVSASTWPIFYNDWWNDKSKK